MNIDYRERDGVLVIVLEGKIMGGTDSVLFHQKLGEWLKEGYRRFVIDLEKVDWMNSSGLGLLLSGLKMIRESDGALRLARLTEKIRNILKITKLTMVFRVHDTVEDAVKSF